MTQPTPEPVRSPQEDLYAATEVIRTGEFDSVPAELLTAVLRAEETNLDSRTAAAREVSRAIDAWLGSQSEGARGDETVNEEPSA